MLLKASEMNTVDGLYKSLKQEWKKKSDLKTIGTLLEKLKILLAESLFIPSIAGQMTVQELSITRDVLEIGVQYSILVKDIPSFERYMSQLKCYYYDYKKIIGDSPEMYKNLGLNLLYLLSQNKVAEFHMEFELIPSDIIHSNQFIRYPLALEQYIMEGRYNKIFEAKKTSPTDMYNLFIDMLMQTVRNEIAGCLEKAFEKISAEEAAKRLNLLTAPEIEEFGRKRNWIVHPAGYFSFEVDSSKTSEALPSQELVEKTIFYAKELEMIV